MLAFSCIGRPYFQDEETIGRHHAVVDQPTFQIGRNIQQYPAG